MIPSVQRPLTIGLLLSLTPIMALAQAVEHDVEHPFADEAAGTALFAIALAVIVLCFVGLRERRRQKLLTTFIERGQPIPPALLPREPSRYSELRRGTWLTGLSMGAGAVLYVISGELKVAIWSVIPLCLGLASFVNAVLFYPADGGHQ